MTPDSKTILKVDGCQHAFKDEVECQPIWCNAYQCHACGHHWEDECPAQREDDCRSCGAKQCPPLYSTEVAPCACLHLGT
jgi:hypothetical protein